MNKRKHFSANWRLVILVSIALHSAVGQQLEGTVTANGAQPLINALVKAEAKGGIQTVVTKTDSAGHFVLSNLKTDSVLLSIEGDGRLLFRAIVSSRTQSPLTINLPTPIRKSASWLPVDLASDGQTVFVLDRDNNVSKIATDSTGSQLESVVTLPQSYGVDSIAATRQSLFVTANNSLGCTIFRYTLATKSLTPKLIPGQGTCAGIAAEGQALYLIFTDKKIVTYLESWDASSYKTWSLSEMQAPGPLLLDGVGRQLLLADSSTGKLYSVSLTNGKSKFLADKLGWANALAADSKHIAIASGKTILFLSRTDYRGEEPPPNLKSLTGGHIVGLAIDGAGKLWFADYDKHLLQGPLSLN